MANDFQVLISAAIDIQKAQNILNSQINQLKVESIKVGINLDNASAKKAIKDLSADSQRLLSQNKIILDNKLTTYLKENTKLSSELKSEIQSIHSNISNVDTKGLKDLQKQFAITKTSAESLGQTGRNVLGEFGNNIQKFASWYGVAGITVGSVNTIKDMVANVSNLDDSLIELRKVSDLSGDALERFTDKAYAMGAEVARTGKEVIDATTVFKRAGYTLDESFDLAKTSLVMVNVGDGIKNVEDAASALIATLKGFKLSDTDALSIVDMINETSNNAPIDFDNITEGLRRVSGTLSQTGASIQETIGLLTGGFGSLRDIEMVSSGLIMISQRLRGIGEDGEAIDGLAPKLKKEFKEIANIDIEDSNGELRNTYDILNDMSRVFPTLTSKQQQYLGELAAGNRQVKVLNSIVQGWSDVESATTSATNSQGSALRENEKVIDGITGKTNAFKSAFQELSSTTVNSEWIKFFIDLGTSILKAVNAIGGLIPVLTTVGVIFLGFKTNILPTLIGQIQMLILAQTGYTASTVSAALAQVGLAGAIKATTTAMISFLATNPVGWAILAAGAIFGTVKAYEYFNVTLEDNQEALANLKGEYDSVTSEVKSLEEQIKSIQSKMKEMEKLNPVEFVNDDEYQKLSDSNDQLDRRLTIQKELQRIAGKNAEEKAIETIGTRSEKSLTSTYTTSTEGMVYKSNTFLTREDAIQERINAYNEVSKSIDEIITKQEQLAIANQTESKDYKILDKQLKDATDIRDNYYDYILKTMQTLDAESESIIGATKNGEQYATSIDNLGDHVNDFITATKQATGAIENTSDALSEANKEIVAFDISTYEKQIDTLQSSLSSLSSAQEKLAKGKLSSSEVLDLLQEFPQLIPYVDMAADGFGDLSKGLTEVAGIRTEGLVNDLTSIRDTLSDTDKIALDTAISALKQMGDESTNTSSGVLSLSDALSALISNSKLVDTIKENIKEFGYITSSTLNDIASKYPELEGVVADYLAGLASTEDVLAGLKTAYDKDFNNYRNSVIAKKSLDVDFYNTVVKNLGNDVKEKAKAYGIDFDNYKNLTEAKLAMEKELSQKILNLQRAQSVSSIATQQASLTGSGTDNALAFKLRGMQDSANKELEDFQKIINGMDTSIDSILSLNDYKGLSGENADKDKNKFSQVFDWLSIRIDKLKEKAQSTIDSIAKYTSYKSKNSKIDIAVNAKVDEAKSLKTIQDSYNGMAKKVGLPVEYQKLVDEGGMNVQTVTDEKLAGQIEEYTKWKDAADAVGKSIEEINEEVEVLQGQKLDNIKSYFDMKNGRTESKISVRESEIALKEANGQKVTKGDYNYLINREKENIKNAEDEAKAYTETFNEQLALGSKNGGFDLKSPEYFAGLNHLNELAIAANEARMSIIDLSNEKIKLTFEPFDTKMEKSNKVISEVDQAVGFVDGNSIEQIALFQTGYAQATQNVKDLNAEINKLNKQYAGNTNDVVYKERLADLESQLSTNANAMQSYQQSIISAMKARYDKELNLSDKALKAELKNIEKAKKARLDALKAELDKYKEIIDARKKALRDEQETDEYDESVAQYNKDISKLESRISTLKQAELSDDMTARQERLVAEEELDKLKKDLGKLQKDRSIDLAEDALDSEYDAYEEMKNKQIKDAESFYDLQTEQAQLVYDNKVLQLESLYENERQLIIEAAQLTQDKFTEAFASINSTMGSYGLGVSSDLTSALGVGNTYANSTAKSSPLSSILGAQSESNKYSQDTSDLSGLNKYLASKGYGIVSKEQMVKLAQSLGLSDINSAKMVGTDEIGRVNKTRILDALKKAGFSKGGYVDASMVKATGEDGLALVKHGEPILTVEQGKLFKELVSNLQPLNNLVKLSSPDLTKLNASNSSPIVNINLPANTTISKDAINDYNKFISDITNKVSDEILTKSNSR